MKKWPTITIRLYLLLLLMVTGFLATAQLRIIPQIRTRTEVRNGTGTPLPVSNDPAIFTSQRSRITVNYHSAKIRLQLAAQDVRVWGQDASTISNADGIKTGLHEAWAGIVLLNDTATDRSEYLFIKIGRQELLYDDSRLLGNLDWLQQARRHDALLLKWRKKGWMADAGFAFNQNTDAFNYNGTTYTPVNAAPYIKDSRGNLMITPGGFIPMINGSGNSAKTGSPAMLNAPGTNAINHMYKSMQFLYLSKDFGNTSLSWLSLSDQFGRYSSDSIQNISGMDTGYVYGLKFNRKGVYTRVTSGFLLNSTPIKSLPVSINAGFYFQGGKDKEGKKLSAYSSTLGITYNLKNFSFTGGWDYLSGNNALRSSAVNHRFDPLYGTPHKFWGTMDYFYVGTGSPTGGLNNPFFKTKYKSGSGKFNAGIDYHWFALAADMAGSNGKAISRYLGSEMDLALQYNPFKFISIEGGLSYMISSNSMAYAKNQLPANVQRVNSWAWLQVSVRPEVIVAAGSR